MRGVGPVEPVAVGTVWLSNKLFALWVGAREEYDYNAEPLYYRTGVAGVATTDTTITGAPTLQDVQDAPIYASYNPRDGRVAESSSPVNWV